MLTMLQAASMLLANGAQAQANACDVLKGVLAARIEATGVRGYTLEAAPAGTPVPRDAKVIGTCEGGASKILYRRWGAARASSDGESAAASVAQADAAADEQPSRPPSVRGDHKLRAVPVPAPTPTPTPTSVPTPKSTPVPLPVPASAPSPTPRTASRSQVAASAAPAPLVAPESPVAARASEAEPVPVIERVDTPPTQGPLDKTAEVKVPLTQRASEFMAAHWRWVGALLLLPVAGWLWAWRAHRSAYDEAGLPRGPRL